MLRSVKLINLPKIEDRRGKLTFIQEYDHIPFNIEDVYWKSYEKPVEHDHGYALKKQDEIIVALSGSFDVVIKNKDENEDKYKIQQSHFALYIPSNTWRHVENTSPSAISLHLSNKSFNKKEFITNIQYLL